MALPMEVRSIVHDVLSERLSAVVDNRFDAGEFRLSESAKCGRYRVAKVLGMVKEEHDEVDAGYFERGHLIERWVVEGFRRKFPRRCRTQQTVKTPFGDTGHIDLWFPAERRIIEVKSVSDREQDLPRPEHVMQVQAYMHFLRNARGERRADSSELVYVRYGRQLSYEVHIVPYDEAVGQAIEDELRMLHEYAERYELPPIPSGYDPMSPPCMTYYGRAERCPLWSVCWKGSDRAPKLDAPEVADWVRDLAMLDAEKKALKAQEKTLEEAMKDIQAKLGALLDIYGVKQVSADGVTVTRTVVTPKPKFDMEAALADGALPTDVVERYQKVPKPYETWYVKRPKGQKEDAE
ncbi:PD-(D/E)XK nuclease family protein [Alicyclobacillus vulcanalis]|uniref:PD-(D/E)XK endonuclease-like domain-containing protein n=1 Tax=Alicyclobacillus vulcanalis TaxID=252246 RepID=A0A1N7MS50_9BACL|nr:PD-(D/E)XK nuclease family protein [Alicyclobacillus vulcanalis]SIS88946.1 hypothetical protein SAMN05421799_10669 [Alicyclobacillus vulcanalis]